MRKNSEGGVRWEGEGVWDMVRRCVVADIAERSHRWEGEEVMFTLEDAVCVSRIHFFCRLKYVAGCGCMTILHRPLRRCGHLE